LRRSLGTAGHPRVVVRPPRGRSRESLRCTPSVPPRWGRREGSSKSAKRPTTRPCSAYESVVSRRRCQRDDTRSFHGLCSPPRSFNSRSSPTMPSRRLPPPNRGPRRLPGRWPTRRTALTSGPLGSLRRFTRAGSRPKPVAGEALRGAEAKSERAAFSEALADPRDARRRAINRGRLGDEAVSPKSVREVKSWVPIGDARSVPEAARRRLPLRREPRRGRPHRPSWGF
jgi:hypothetical protein